MNPKEVERLRKEISNWKRKVEELCFTSGKLTAENNRLKQELKKVSGG